MRFIKLILCFFMVLGLSGCAPNVRELIKQKKYDEAIKTLKDKKDSYSKKEYKALMDECNYYKANEYFKKKSYKKAYSLLNRNDYKKTSSLLKQVKPKYNNQVRCEEVMNTYHALAKEMKENFEGEDREYSMTTGDNYYMNVGANIYELEKSLKKNKMPTKSMLLQVFNKVPTSITEANKWLGNIKKYFVWKLGAYKLAYCTDFLRTFDYKYTSGDVSKKEGHYYIDDIYNFTENWHVSPRVLGCAFLVFQDYGAEITSKDSSIIITWPYDTSGYYMCDTFKKSTQNDDLLECYKCVAKTMKIEQISNNGNTCKGCLSFKMPPVSCKHIFIHISFTDRTEENSYDEVLLKFHNTNPNQNVKKYYTISNIPQDTDILYDSRLSIIKDYT